MLQIPLVLIILRHAFEKQEYIVLFEPSIFDPTLLYACVDVLAQLSSLVTGFSSPACVGKTAVPHRQRCFG